MRQFVDVVPPNGVEVINDRGVDVALLYKDPRTTTDTEGREVLSANVQRIEFPEGADAEDIAAHFDYYFDAAERKEVKQAADLKISRIESMLSGKDYKLFKFLEGVLSVDDYAPWKKLRQHWRDTVNKMEAAKTIEELDAIVFATTPEGLADLQRAGLV